MSNPIEDSGLYDYILLGGMRSPGLATLEGGGERAQKWENQQAPGFAGAVTIFKGEEVSKVSYIFMLWTVEHFAAWEAFVATLRAGTKKRPPQVYDLVDPAISWNEIKSVAVASIGALQRVAPSKWSVKIELTEYRKPKPTGGPIKPAQNDQEKVLEEQTAKTPVLQAKLDAAKAAAKKDRAS